MFMRMDVLTLPQRVTQIPDGLVKHSTPQAMPTLQIWTPLLELETFPFFIDGTELVDFGTAETVI